MHFHSLAVIQIPEQEEHPDWEETYASKVNQLEAIVQAVPGNLLAQIELRHARSLNSAFAVQVEQAIDSLMHPYGSESEDCYEFCDYTAEVTKRYCEETTDAIRLPEGKIVDRYNRRVWGKFKIIDGKVYEEKVGKQKMLKRSHKAKKMSAVLNCSFRKIYKSLHEFATDYCSYDFDDESQRYGYYCNPNAMWDWYQIGGRWPVTFLVKEGCSEYSYGERSWGNAEETYPAPAGFKWVSAARKKDIQWDAMKAWRLQAAQKQFKQLEAMYVTSEAEPEKHLHVKDGCVYDYCSMIYKIGETEESYLKRHGFDPDRKYHVSFCDLIDESEWIAEGEVSARIERSEDLSMTWRDMIEDYIDDLDADDVLVSVDYHM